jgi:hypothetical protein
MIKSHGYITGLSATESAAIQEQLIAKGLKWCGGSKAIAPTNTLYWSHHYLRSHQYLMTNSMLAGFTEHTLADFGLNDKIKPFRDGDRVVADTKLTAYIRSNGFKLANVSMTFVPLNDLTYNEGKVAGKGVCLRVGLLGAVYDGIGNIVGYILPAPEQTSTHEYQFGDKIKVHRGDKARMYLGEIKGRVLYCIDDSRPPWHTSTIYNSPLSDITPWPTPVQFPLNDYTTIQVDENAVSFINADGIQSGPLSIIDKLVEARKNMNQ